MYSETRQSADSGTSGAMSLTTRRRTGEFGTPANAIPIMPPSEVPTQSKCSAPMRAASTVRATLYCARW